MCFDGVLINARAVNLLDRPELQICTLIRIHCLYSIPLSGSFRTQHVAYRRVAPVRERVPARPIKGYVYIVGDCK